MATSSCTLFAAIYIVNFLTQGILEISERWHKAFGGSSWIV